MAKGSTPPWSATAARRHCSPWAPPGWRSSRYLHQVEMLEDLEAERLKGHHRNLVVAATGTGKTVIAALDYKRLCDAGRP